MISRLVKMPGEEQSEFQREGDGPAREEALNRRDNAYRASSNTRFATLVVMDLAPSDPKSGDPPREGVTAPSLKLVLESAGARGMRFLAGSRDLSQGDASATAGNLMLDAAPLLIAAVRLPENAKAGLAGQVDLTPLDQPVRCELAYQRFGVWLGELTLTESPPSGLGGRAPPLRISRARIILEPLTP
jgi:hypothetical protein